MSILEAALRGGAVMLLLACIAAYVVESAPGSSGLDLRVRVPIHVVTNTTSAIFWVTMGTLFVDDFRPRRHALRPQRRTMLIELSVLLRSDESTI